MNLSFGLRKSNNQNIGLKESKRAYQQSFAQRLAARGDANITSSRRRSVARPGSNEFTLPENRTRSRSTRRVSSPSYSSTKKTRKKAVRKKSSSSSSQSLSGWKSKLFLSIIALLGLRLVFMNNGLIDYYKMEETLKNKEKEYFSIIQENKDLKQELKLIKSSRSYQKKLARENLGVISSDEYLVLFAQEK